MSTQKTSLQKNNTPRPPVVVVMGHIDHGKSTLLDYIRSSNSVAGEAGGITQHISAYEIEHSDTKGTNRRITFLDTPGHAAFTAMRSRGAKVADVAILVVSAEDGVKPQTLEALKQIQESETPFVVAINKIDKAGADIEKTKMSLVEHSIFIEGYGGDIPVTPISAKTGAGIDDLLETVLLLADMDDLSCNTDTLGRGYVIESHLDQKRGVTATLILKNGTLSRGMFIVVGDAISTTRIIEDFRGKPQDSFIPSAPVQIVGFDSLPAAGDMFECFATKKEAEESVRLFNEFSKKNKEAKFTGPVSKETVLIPLIIKSDTQGTGDAVEKEITKLTTSEVVFKILNRGVGSITDIDIQQASTDKSAIIIGFNTKLNKQATEMNDQYKVTIYESSIIYELIENLEKICEDRRPRKEIVEVSGAIKILKTFSQTKDKQVIGGRVENGKVAFGSKVRIIRRENEIGTGTITALQQSRISIKEAEEGNECGLQVESRTEIATGDVLEAFTVKVV
jgi:translation initiation factor IF-2